MSSGSNVGDTVGWFGFAAEDDTFLTKRKIKVRGYPGDKTFGTQWTMNGKIKELEPKRSFYGHRHFRRSERIARLRPQGRLRCGCGIHAYGVGGSWTNNSATRHHQRRVRLPAADRGELVRTWLCAAPIRLLSPAAIHGAAHLRGIAAARGEPEDLAAPSLRVVAG